MLTYNESSRYRLEKDGTLVIKEVDKDHDAVAYTCTAMNLKGEASVSAVLDVLGKHPLCFILVWAQGRTAISLNFFFNFH